MKHISFLLSDSKAYKKAIKRSQKNIYSTQLIQIFTSVTNKKMLQKIVNKLSKEFKDALIIGTTTAGEISHAKMYDNSTVISLSLFENTQIQATYSKKITFNAGKNLAKKICTHYTKAAIVLSEGLQGKNYEGFIKGIKEQNPNLIIAGGLAGDNFKLKQTFVIYKNKIYEKGSVAVSFSGKKLFANNKYNLNWTPIGKSFTITSATGNVLHSINNEDAVSHFKRYLGEEVFQDNARSLPDFPLLYKEGSTTVSRTPLIVDGTSIIFAAPLKVGQEVQFGFSNAAAVIAGSQKINSKIDENPAEAIYIFSCIARKTLLGKVLEKEFESFDAVAPTSGFFTYGEFYSTDVNNSLLNCTTTILILSENSTKKQKSKKILKNEHKDLESITFSALTHFIKQTSVELEENLQLLNQYKIAVDMTSLVSKTDIKGNITYVNDNFCRVSQYTREELLGKNHNIVRSNEVSDFIFKKMWHNITRGRVWRGLLSNRAKDGSIYYVDATIIPITNESGEIQEYMAIRQDVTKQIQSKKRIQEKEKLIKAIFDNQDSIVIYASKSHGMISVNRKLFDYLDYKNIEDFKEKHTCICDLFLEEDGYVYPKKYPNWIDEIASQKSPTHKARIKIKDGSVHTFNIIIKRIDDEYIINLYDITSLEDALHKAHLSEQVKATFLANMSHEIRTPLNGILGFTDILLKKELNKDAKRYVDIIHKSGQTLLNVVNDILDFSKLESGELSLYESENNLFEEMEATVSTFASLSKNKQIDYYTYIDTNIPKTLKCDVQRIKQVVNNLASNAIKFTPQEGEVKIKIVLKSIQNNKATIYFSVQDSGIGIPAEKIESIFNSFSQADDSISREFGGTGLGLSISSQYVEMMGSKLQVKSEVGKGSEFYFTLELPIINKEKAFNNTLNKNSINIALLNSHNNIECGINEVVSTYLSSWNLHFQKIDDIHNVDEKIDIIIVCAKLFQQKDCQDVLNKYPKLQLIYIEGAQKNFNCTHKKFHPIEQPMTGSALFDKIITLTNLQDDILETTKEEHLDNYEGNVLVAEDNLTNQMLISIMLEERGLHFKVVSNGQEVLDEIQKNDIYDLIFMDINMPILDGISATKALREQGYTKPIVSLSANVIESDIRSYKEAGIDETLNKPLVPAELNGILNHYLTQSVAQEEILSLDSVNIEKISKELFIENKTIILKLLNSFATSASSIVQKLQEAPLDVDIAHNLKGLSGNLRFHKLYALISKYEQELEGWSEDEHEKYKKVVLIHLENLINEIALLNK